VSRYLQKKAFSGCGAGKGFSYIRFDGEVWPCNFIPLAAGNVREKSFSDIWDKSPLLQEFRGQKRQLQGICGNCDEQSICGGCRGRAYAHTGDPFAADPNCLLKR
jgi:radical SAM protein with 4Fe4S-binding SPASM domain